jgi:hypothetical protein
MAVALHALFRPSGGSSSEGTIHCGESTLKVLCRTNGFQSSEITFWQSGVNGRNNVGAPVISNVDCSRYFQQAEHEICADATESIL